jgi:hypothetical protein
MWPFKNAQQERIDSDAVVIANLTRKLEETTEALAKEKKDGREKGRLASELLAERDAARIERDTAQRERDEYRVDALKFRNSQVANQRRHLEAAARRKPAAAASVGAL